MDTLLQDLRHAARALRRNPIFTIAAVVTLALGIGANTAVFSVVNAVLIRALPYPDPDGIVYGWGRRGAERVLLASGADVLEWRRRNHTLADLGLERSQSVNLTGVDAPDRLIGSFVTASTLTILGARAERGRLFTAEETEVGTGQAVAVLSHGAWVSRFGSDPNIIGRTLTLNARPHVVIGVLDRRYRHPFDGTDVFLPITSAPPNWASRGAFGVWAVMRLKPGVTVDQAQQELSGIAAQLAAEHPDTNNGWDANLIPLKEQVVGQLRPVLFTIFGFVAVVLLIACANVANLQMARATGRQRELSLRAALGAGRLRLARQLFTENLLLSALGGALGLLIGTWGTRLLVAAVPGGLPSFANVGLDGMVLAFSVLATLGAGLVFGTAPALYGGRVGLRASMDARSPAGGKRIHARDVVVAAQLALSVVLLVGAGLLTRTLVALRHVDPGFDASHVLTAEFRLPAAKYKSDERISAFMADALAAIRKVPGIRDAALVQAVPLSGNFGSVPYEVDGAAAPAGEIKPSTLANTVSEGFFRTMAMPIRAGRDFDANDRPNAPLVAIVSEEFARQAWPGKDPLGRRVKVFGPPDQTVTVVGLVGNLKQHALSDPPSAQIYQPMTQGPDIFNSVVARTDGDPDALGKSLRAAIWSVDRDQPVWKVRSLQFLVDRDIAPRRFALTLAGIFAALALVLATVGVYGVMSYLLVQRTREVGIRIALGARRSQVVRLVLRRGAQVVGVAIVVGTIAAIGAGRLLNGQLYGVDAADPLTLVVVPLLLGGVALFATYLPARRAAKVDPMVALRSE